MLELDGEPAGYALYRIHMKFEGGASVGHVDVIEAVADGLWQRASSGGCSSTWTGRRR